MTLVEFLHARLDEDERHAHHAKGILGAETPWWTWSILKARLPGLSRADAQHIERHSPRRVLAEVEAKQQIIAEHQPEDGVCRTCTTQDREVLWDGETETVEWVRRPVPAPCPTLRALTLPYTSHPHSQPEQRP